MSYPCICRQEDDKKKRDVSQDLRRKGIEILADLVPMQWISRTLSIDLSAARTILLDWKAGCRTSASVRCLADAASSWREMMFLALVVCRLKNDDSLPAVPL